MPHLISEQTHCIVEGLSRDDQPILQMGLPRCREVPGLAKARIWLWNPSYLAFRIVPSPRNLVLVM